MPFVAKSKVWPDSFSWDEYLRQTEERPAPKKCFKQAEKPPVNLFEIGMKLESRDPRNDRSFSVATVISIQGPRLRLRLDGSDNRNDFWSLLDSVDIHQVGWCDSQGDLLQPPLGFSKNASFWPTFLSKLLSENKNRFAPKECFKEEPPSPPKNLFQVGMKLEAIDKKNPHIIGPATVGEVVGEKILVTFDGWRGASDYWCRYDSREIFPVGWCASVGHYLQHPGTKGGVGRKSLTSTKSPSLSPHIPMHIDTTSTGAASPTSSHKSGSRKHSPATPGTSVQPSPGLLSPGASLSPGHATDLHTTNITATAYVNQTCVCGPLLNETKVIRLPLQFGPGPIQRIARKLVQAIVDSANNPLQVFRLVIAGESSSAIIVKNERVNTVNLPQFSTDLALHNYIKNLLHGVECCKNLVTFQPLARICQYCQTNKAGPSGNVPPPTAEPNVAHRSLSAPAGVALGELPGRRRPGRPPGKRGRRKTRLARLESARRHAYGRRDTERSTSGTNELTQLHVSTNSNQENIPQITPSNSSGYMVPRPATGHRIPSTSPLDWTPLDVISYVKSVDPGLSKFAHLFVTHEIDGRAFLLITSDVAIKYMKMKVGPAVKLCSLVDRLKMSL